MESKMQIFDSAQFGRIRTFDVKGNPWFVGRDVAVALGYKETAKAVREKVDIEDKGVSEIDTPGGKQQITIINALAFDLLDGRHIECAVTDIDDKAIRFDSVDCLGDDMTYGKVEKWLDRIDHLMPDELREAIVDTERKHTIDGKKVCRLERLFLPAASELFSGDAVLGDDGLYKQMDWYKDRRHRMKMDEHGGDSTAYWTSSQRSGNSSLFCIVSYAGAASSDTASNTWLSAPVCFRIRKS